MLGTAFSRAGTGGSQGGQLCVFNGVCVSHMLFLSGTFYEHSGVAD